MNGDRLTAALKSILLVEDNDEIRSIFATIFQAEGCHGHEAENGWAAMALMRQGLEPDLILLDLMMPIMDGRTFHEKRGEYFPEALRDVPVIVLSGHGRPPQGI